MKYVLLGSMSLILFIGTIAGALLLTGHLNEAGLNQLLGREPSLEEAGGMAATGGDVGPLAQALRTKEEELRQREEALDAREKKIELRMSELESLQAQLKQLQASIDTQMQDEETARRARVQSQAISIAAMKPENAAELLQQFPPDEAAEILFFEADGKPAIDKRVLGKILDSLDTDFATNLMRAQQTP